MARLRVRLRGKPVTEVTLAEGHIYMAGRRDECDIVLEAGKGISREHFKISFVDGHWTVELTSRYGEIFHNGEQVQQFHLQHGTVFSVPPYEFEYLMTSDEAQAQDGDSPLVPAVQGAESSSDFDGNSERTVIGVAPSAAYIKMIDAANETKELIRLEDGDTWIAGRESSCQIHIKDPRVSRRQFEVRRAGSQYLIVDLGSVNGTLVNGNPISASDSTVLRSGDAISVLDNYLYFELHDSSFQSRLELVNLPPPNSLIPTGQDMPMPYQGHPNEMAPYYNQAGAPVAYQPQAGYPAPVMPPPEGKGPFKNFDFQKNRPKLIVGAVLFLAVVYLFSGNDGDIPNGPQGGMVTPGSPADIFNKLKPEQQGLVKQRYKDAKNLYMQGKYQLAQDEIIKIQELVPDYEDIREIERLSKEAIYIKNEQEKNARIAEERRINEEKIQMQVDICQKKINPDITSSELEECLTSVLEFNPEHPKFGELRSQVEVLTVQREAKAAERAAYQDRVARLKSIYQKAEKVHKVGKPLDAIAAYEKVVDSSLPDPSGLKGDSRRNIASIRKMMNSKTATLQEDAEKFYQAQNLRGAIQSLRKARLIDPTNDEIPEKIDRYVAELRKQMMSLYQEGILEESFGNVDGGESKSGAKEKWRKILELDIPDGDYYKKAYIKLKKYGAL